MAMRVRTVGPQTPIPKARIPGDQKVFSHHSIKLERFGEALFGKKYRKAIDRSDMGFWKELYLSTFEVLHASVLTSIGSVDRSHRSAIEEEIESALATLQAAKSKDEINAAIVASLLDLVFLLLGRRPYRSKGKRRNLSTFRTLTYSQTDEQLSWLLQSHIQRNPSEHGFSDSVNADLAYLRWTQANKRVHADRSAYVAWVREAFPSTYRAFR